jgi:hypothetical protein
MNKYDLTSSQIYEKECAKFGFWRGMKIAAVVWLTIILASSVSYLLGSIL